MVGGVGTVSAPPERLVGYSILLMLGRDAEFGNSAFSIASDEEFITVYRDINSDKCSEIAG